MNERGLQNDIYQLKQKVRSLANEVSYSMSEDEKQQVRNLLEEIDNIEDSLEEFDELLNDVWNRAEEF